MKIAQALFVVSRKIQRGFAMPDLMVVVAVIFLLAAIATSAMIAAHEKSSLARCADNLKRVNTAILAFSQENQKTLPAAVTPGENIWWTYKEQVKSFAGLHGPPSTNDTLFACPSDRGYTDAIPFRSNDRFGFCSYVFNGVTLPGMPNVAGWKTYDVKEPQKTLLVMEFSAHGPMAWHYSKTGNRNLPFYNDAQSMVAFVDGHASFTKIYYDGYNAAFTQDPIPGYDYKYSGN